MSDLSMACGYQLYVIGELQISWLSGHIADHVLQDRLDAQHYQVWKLYKVWHMLQESDHPAKHRTTTPTRFGSLVAVVVHRVLPPPSTKLMLPL